MKNTLILAAVLLSLSAQAQNVGIGETAPANKLSVKGGFSVGTGYSTTAAPTNGAIIQGNVGIGTPSPTASLHIMSSNTTGNTVQLRLTPTGGGGSSSSVPSTIDFYSTFDAYTADQNPRRTASIKGAFSGGVWGNEILAFEVGSAGDAAVEPSEKMRINASGYVGIGTTNPQGPLDVNGRASASSIKFASSFADLTNSSPWYGIGMSNLTLSGQGGTAVQVAGFYGINFAEAGGNQMVINHGQVGIGTTNPGYTLDVAGTGHVSGNLTVGGAIPGRVWSASLGSSTAYGITPVTLLSATVTTHGGNVVAMGKLLDQTNNNNENRNNLYLYRTTSNSGYNGAGSALLDTWTFWQATNGNPINESAVVMFTDQPAAGTYYYWLVASCEVSGFTRTALTTGTKLIVYEF